MRAKGRNAKFDTRSKRKRVFSRCAFAPALPQGRQPMVKNRFQNRMDKRQTIMKQHEISGSRRRPPKKAPNMTSRRLPGTLREPPGKRAPRRPQEPPRAPPRAWAPPWRPLWAHMAPRGAPEASRPSFGVLRAPSGSIFGFILMIFRHSFLIRSLSCSCLFSLACSCSLFVFEGFKP